MRPGQSLRPRDVRQRPGVRDPRELSRAGRLQALTCRARRYHLPAATRPVPVGTIASRRDELGGLSTKSAAPPAMSAPPATKKIVLTVARELASSRAAIAS